MAAVPADVLAPEAAAAFGVGALELRVAAAVVGCLLVMVVVRWEREVVVGASRGRGGKSCSSSSSSSGRRRCGRPARIQLLGNVGDGAFEGDGAGGGVLGHDVGFGADDVDDEAVVLVGLLLLVFTLAADDAALGLEFAEPGLHVLPAGFVGDVVAEQAGVRAAVVEAREAPEAFLARCVPDLEAYGGGGVRVEDAFGVEGGADGGLRGGGGGGGEGVGGGDEAVDEGGFADALGAEDYEFGFEGGGEGGRRGGWLLLLLLLLLLLMWELGGARV